MAISNRDRDVRVVVGYKVDKASAQQVIAQNHAVAQAVTAELDKTRRATVSVEDVASSLNRQFGEMARARGIDQMTQDAIAAGKKTDDWAASLRVVSEELSAIGASEDEINRVAQAIGDAQAGSSGSGSGRRAVGSLGQVGRDIRNLPALQIAGNISTDAVGKLLYAADPLIEALGGALSPAMIGVTAAVTAGSIALKLYSDAQAAAASALRTRLDAEAEVTRFLTTATTEQLEAKLDALRIEKQAELEIATQRAAVAGQELARLNAGTAALNLLVTDNPYNAAMEKLKESNANVQELTIQINAYENALGSARVATNDLISTERQLAEQRQRSNADISQGDVEARREADRLTAEERRTRIAEIQREIDNLTLERDRVAPRAGMTDSDRAAAQALADEYQRQIDRLGRDQIILGQTSQSYADRLEAEEAAKRLATTATSAMIKADNMTAEQRQTRIAEIEHEIDLLRLFDDGSQATQDQIADLTAEADGLRAVFHSLADATAEQAAAAQALKDTTDQQLDAATQYVTAQEAVFKAQQAIAEYSAESAQKLLDLEASTAEKREELIADTDERELEILEDGAEKRAKVLKQATDAYTDAVAERDALAGLQARKKAQESLDEQDKAQKKQLEKLERAEEKKLQSYQKQYDKQYVQLVTSINNESAQRQLAYQRALVDAQNAAFLISATQQQYANAAVQAYNVGYITAQNYIAGLRAGGTGGFTSSTALPPVSGTAANTTINVNGGLTAAQLTNIIQQARRSGGGGYRL